MQRISLTFIRLVAPVPGVLCVNGMEAVRETKTGLSDCRYLLDLTPFIVLVVFLFQRRVSVEQLCKCYDRQSCIKVCLMQTSDLSPVD